jgi:putative aldouronate transport system permease protein
MPVKTKQKHWNLLIIALPFMLFLVLMKYVPIGGWIIGLYDYKPGMPLFENEYIGFKYFASIFHDRDILRALKNTLIFSGAGYLLSPLPMIFAIALNEITNTKFRKMAQTITTLPHFISWVIVYSLAFAIFSNDGVLNTVLLKLNLIGKPTSVLTNSNLVYPFQIAISTWKNLGWNSIIYIAAIAGIEQEQYEAAQIEGAGRFRCAIHITLPGILPTYLVLLLLSISNFINTGSEQYFVFKNSMVFEKIEVLDLYIYRMGLQLGDYSYATAVGIVKSFFSIVMLVIANTLAKKIRGTSII